MKLYGLYKVYCSTLGLLAQKKTEINLENKCKSKFSSKKSKKKKTLGMLIQKRESNAL